MFPLQSVFPLDKRYPGILERDLAKPGRVALSTTVTSTDKIYSHNVPEVLPNLYIVCVFFDQHLFINIHT